MSKNALIIPVHPPKSNWLISFLNSVARFHDSDLPFRIVLAASNYGEYRFFNRLRPMLPFEKSIEIFCVENYIVDTLGYGELSDRFRQNADRCIINVKKFIALHWAMANGFEWAICADCDMAAIAPIDDIFDILKINYDSGQYFGKNIDLELFLQINQACRMLFSEVDQRLIKRITNDDAVYTWFFDIPFYALADVKSLFDFMANGHGSLERWFCKLTWHTFDHIVFLLWRCVAERAGIIEYGDLGRFPEHLTFADLMRLKAKFNYCPAWLNTGEVLREPDIVNSLRALRLMCHFDRL